MDQTTLIVTGINIIIAGIVGFITAAATIGQYKNKVDNLETTVGKDEHGGLRQTLGEVRDKVIACETILKERGPLTQAKSPVRLTDRGESFLQESGCKDFVDNNFEDLLKKVEALSPQTAYDVQEGAKKVIESVPDDEKLNQVKDFLFKDGSTMEDARKVMGVYLRDKVLAHKKWNVQDIDTQEATG